VASTALADVLPIIGILLILVGLGLAFAGRKLWTPFMSLVGAIIDGSIGYLVGEFYSGGSGYVPLLTGLVGSILGSILFNYLVKIAMALIAAGIPAILTYYALGGNAQADQMAQDAPVLVAILVLLIVFALAYYFVEELIGVVTSLVGAFLLGAGVFLLTGSVSAAIGAAALVFLVGVVVQTLAVRAAKKGGAWRLRRRRAQAVAQAPPARPTVYAPPPSPPPPPPPPPFAAPPQSPEPAPPPPPPV